MFGKRDVKDFEQDLRLLKFSPFAEMLAHLRREERQICSITYK
jgi:hypothetical protein